MREVLLFFDFVSPYSYLGLAQAPAFAEQHGIRWRYRPVVYGALLDATGLVGPAEVRVKRRYTFRDLLRCAHLAGVPFTGAPAHPFRSLEALRMVCLFEDDPACEAVVLGLAAACWGDGRDLTDIGVLESVARDASVDATDLGERIAAPEIKARLKTHTDEALAAGVFGVPSFLCDGALFWGHDRMSHLAAMLEGRLDDSGSADGMLSRPRGVDRKKLPAQD